MPSGELSCFCSVAPWAAGAVPAVPSPKPTTKAPEGLHRGCTRCPLLLVAFPQQAAPSKPQRFPGRASQQAPEERVVLGRLAVFSRRWQGGLWAFCISAAISWGWAAAKWPRLVLSTAGTEQSPASPGQEFGSQGQELSHVLHVPGICHQPLLDPGEVTPALLPLSSGEQGKHSRRNSVFGVMDLGQKQQQPGGNTLLFPHYLCQRAGMGENPACPQAAQKDGRIKAMRCHTAPRLSTTSLCQSRGCSRTLGSPTASRAGSASDEKFQSLNSKLTHGLC